MSGAWAWVGLQGFATLLLLLSDSPRRAFQLVVARRAFQPVLEVGGRLRCRLRRSDHILGMG